jgi:hypothetical protein
MGAPRLAEEPGMSWEGTWDIWGGRDERWYAARREKVTAVEADAGCPPFIGAGDRATLCERIGAWEDLAARGRAGDGKPLARDLAAVIGQSGGRAVIAGRAVQAIEVRRPGSRHSIVLRSGWQGSRIAWVWSRAGCPGHVVPQEDVAAAAAMAMDCTAGHPLRGAA